MRAVAAESDAGCLREESGEVCRLAYFEDLVANHRWVAVDAVRSVLGRCNDEEDIVQEAFLRLYQRLNQPGDIRVGAWLRQVTRNLAIDALRRSKALAFDDEILDRGIGDGLDGHAVRGEVREKLMRCLDELPRRQREALLIQANDQELGRHRAGERRAASMGLSVDAFESLVMRGRSRLRSEMARCGIDVARAFTVAPLIATKRLFRAIRLLIVRARRGARSAARRVFLRTHRLKSTHAPLGDAAAASHQMLPPLLALIPAAVVTGLLSVTPSTQPTAPTAATVSAPGSSSGPVGSEWYVMSSSPSISGYSAGSSGNIGAGAGTRPWWGDANSGWGTSGAPGTGNGGSGPGSGFGFPSGTCNQCSMPSNPGGSPFPPGPAAGSTSTSPPPGFGTAYPSQDGYGWPAASSSSGFPAQPGGTPTFTSPSGGPATTGTAPISETLPGSVSGVIPGTITGSLPGTTGSVPVSGISLPSPGPVSLPIPGSISISTGSGIAAPSLPTGVSPPSVIPSLPTANLPGVSIP